MAMTAVARETVFALRRQIAKIEGTLPERLQAPVAATPDAGVSTNVTSNTDVTIVRRGIAAALPDAFLPTGVERLDTALSGGLPKAALSEIHGIETRDAGAVAGFALSLASLILKQTQGLPVLWIGTSEIFREAGFPYARGLHASFGIEPEQLLFSEAPKLVDGRRGGRKDDGTRRRHPRDPRQSAAARPDRDAPAACPGAECQPAGVPAAAGGRARTDGGTCAPHRRVGAGSAAPHHRRATRRLDRPPGLHPHHRQESHGPAWTIHTGVEPR